MQPRWSTLGGVLHSGTRPRLSRPPLRRLLSSLPLHLAKEEDPPSSRPNNGHASLVSAFASDRIRSVAEVQALHAHMAKTPTLQSTNPYRANWLADAYRKAGSLDAACSLLDNIPQPNALSWNLSISIHNQCSQFVESLNSFCVMRKKGLEPTEVTYGSVLSASVMCDNAGFGRQVHGLVRKKGLLSNAYVTTGLVDLFAKTCNLDEAVDLFLENPTDNVVVWNAMIAGSVRNGEPQVAFYVFLGMVKGFCMPNEFTLSSILTACTRARQLELGREIHGWVIKCSVVSDVVVGTALIDLYAKCGNMDSAVKQFLRMPTQNVVSWTSMLSAFVQEDPKGALLLFKSMIPASPDINKYTVTSVLAACASPQMVKEAEQLHSWVLRSGFSSEPVVRTSLISMYLKAGVNDMSEKIFEENEVTKDVASWAAMISGLVQNGSTYNCFKVFRRMNQHGPKPDRICCCSLLSIINHESWGKQMHSYIIKAGLILSVPVASALFTMYSKCGSLDNSYLLFKQMPERDRVAWTSMIAGLTEHGHVGEAIQLFREMLSNNVEPDQVTLSHLVTACAEQCLDRGKQIHGHAIRTGFAYDTLVGGALISMYFKCKVVKTAVLLFHWIPQKDQFSWSCMVSGYAQNRYSQEALLTFQKMLASGFKIDNFSCSSVIRVCADLTKPILGKQLHAHVIKVCMFSDLSVSSALITMYSKCGIINCARRVFDQIEQPDLISWTAMIDGYSQNGKGEDALGIYDLMIRGGIKPDSQTFVSLLSACSHNGLVEEGILHFNAMTEDYGIEPEVPHYACMVDLLGRSGRLKEAVDFIHNMPVEPCALIWSTLLGACRVHGDAELGRLAAQKVLDSEPSDSGAYISLSNISADSGDWREALKIRKSMKGIGVRKEPGWSFVG